MIYYFFQVVSVTQLRGGDAYNVIPESASFGGTFRSMTDEGLSYLMKRVKEVGQIITPHAFTPISSFQSILFVDHLT